MGKDKGTLLFNGKPLLLHVLDSLPLLDEIILVLRNEKQYQSYKELLSTFKENLTVTFDREMDQGPLVGILSGLSVLESDKALIIPCDSPGINPSFVEYMLEHPLDDYDALVPCWGNGHPEPLHSVYLKNKTLPVIEKIIKEGVRDVKSLFDHLQVLYLDADALDPQGIIFSNLNRPQDLEDMKDLKSK
jgi:molybdopterin-guanine dinucleotide biosynthesis protein A